MLNLLMPPSSYREEDRSWWLNDVRSLQGALRNHARLTGTQTADVAIIGGGFTGMWSALALLDRHPKLRITVLDAFRCGEGASSRNGGKAHGYWSSLGRLSQQLGASAALATARLGDKAQDQLRSFCTSSGRDCWWQESGNLAISTAASQDYKIAEAVAVAARMGVADSVVALSQDEMVQHIKAPLFRGGLLYREGATVHPARVAHYLRAEIQARGCAIYEDTQIAAITPTENGAVLHSANGQLTAGKVILTTNFALSSLAHLRPHLTNFSSYATMSRPAPEALRGHGWLGSVGAADLRMFLHYFRKAGDRVLMGAGSGPIGFGQALQAERLRQDKPSLRRPANALQRLLPGFSTQDIERSWGWPIDVTADRLPYAARLKGQNIFYGGGFSGHGVNPTLIIGQCLASLVTGQDDEWTRSPFCQRKMPSLPPEPLRFIGGSAVRWGIMSCENDEEDGHSPNMAARFCAALPRLTGMSIGLR
ncbi:FAD-dependent oxidoreductase [Acidisoma cellulosilytica]|uniref:FAD-dependent oxidoreductase n=1 Tax=Acidisoma cellulosilyticum TaxID=2802395 RepID=A0A963Z759_9PROT|nr:FAD-dependent oxidoreductase [Acidisoma cellulosilyticum]MCB8883749.1 FAD-dependent oxidoreductase [Acidisoma cellulosilyticum]